MRRNLKINLILCVICTICLPEKYTDAVEVISKNSTRNLLKQNGGTEKILKVCPNGIKCVPHIRCPAHLRVLPEERPQPCELYGGSTGLCCTTGDSHAGNLYKKKIIRKRSVENIVTAVEEGRKQFEKTLWKIDNGTRVEESEFANVHSMFAHSADKMQAISIHNNALEEVLAAKALKELEKMTNEESELNLFGANLETAPIRKRCIVGPICRRKNQRYRTFSGRCNNLQNSNWGSAGYPYVKLLPPAYNDGVWEQRSMSVTGNLLRSARQISNAVFPDENLPHPTLNNLFQAWGQSITHDVTRNSVFTTSDGRSVTCCTAENRMPERNDNIGCFTILVGDEDDFYRQFNVNCLNFARTRLASFQECNLSYARQLNENSHLIDGSTLYGSSLNASNSLRTFRGGKLRSFIFEGRKYMPRMRTDQNQFCENTTICFQAGDERASIVLSVTAIHNLVLREHNRLAGILQKLNTHWSDQIIFQETRRILVAMIQHITYNEYLPLMLGHRNMNLFNLYVEKGYSTDYDATVNPSISSEFATAAYRMGHSTVPGQFQLQRGPVTFQDAHMKMDRMIENGFYDDLVVTMSIQPMQSVDHSFSRGITNHLFPITPHFGNDLPTLNCQRGRDHGVRSYNDYVELNGYKRHRNFDYFGKNSNLFRVYEHPDDIDLYVGGVSERPADGAIFGPTFTAIIADQFYRLKAGDRYFYNLNAEMNPGAFLATQLKEIQKVTFAKLVCNNFDQVSEVLPSAFEIPSHRNVPVPCDSLEDIDLRFWSD